MIDDAIEIYLHVIISLRTAQILRQTRDVIQKKRYFPRRQSLCDSGEGAKYSTV